METIHVIGNWPLDFVPSHSSAIADLSPQSGRMQGDIDTDFAAGGGQYPLRGQNHRVRNHADSEPCRCEECRGYCTRPCWPTPFEANKLLDEGYADRLMLDWWADGKGGTNIAILCGALKGHEGQVAPYLPMSPAGCTFFVEGLCQLHDLRLKPIEGRASHHSDSPKKAQMRHRDIALSWDSDAGREVVARWRELTGVQESPW